MVVLIDKETSSAAELLTAALKEIRKAHLVGENTHGKWSAQNLEKLPNQFAIKYTVMQFRSPSGKTYEEVGIQPDVQIPAPKELDLREIRAKFDMQKRVSVDPQLKAALELVGA